MLGQKDREEDSFSEEKFVVLHFSALPSFCPICLHAYYNSCATSAKKSLQRLLTKSFIMLSELMIDLAGPFTNRSIVLPCELAAIREKCPLFAENAAAPAYIL
jgi:hypothetical protein